MHKLLSNPGNYRIADTILVEVFYVLERVYGQERQFIAFCLNLIQSLNQIHCNSALINKVVPLYMANPGLSFAGCCVAIYAQLNKAEPLLTFDKVLAKRLPHAELLGV